MIDIGDFSGAVSKKNDLAFTIVIFRGLGRDGNIISLNLKSFLFNTVLTSKQFLIGEATFKFM